MHSETLQVQYQVGWMIVWNGFLETSLPTALTHVSIYVPTDSCCLCLSEILCKCRHKKTSRPDPKEALFVSIVGGCVVGKYNKAWCILNECGGWRAWPVCLSLHFNLYSSLSQSALPLTLSTPGWLLEELMWLNLSAWCSLTSVKISLYVCNA